MVLFPRFTRRSLLKTASMSLAGMALPWRAKAIEDVGPGGMAADFVTPPLEARPWVYWYFMDGNLTAEGMSADLDAMKRAGIGGGIYLEVNIGLPAGPVAFMSDKWQELVTNAFARADELGIEIALAAGAGWCGAGGPWVKPEESMQFLTTSETRVQGPSKFDAVLPQPKPRTPFFGEDTLTPELREIWQKFYVDTFVLAFPAPQGEARVADVDEKALYTRGSYSSQILGPYAKRPWVRPFIPETSTGPVVDAKQCVAQASVQDLTSRLGPDGHLQWEVPPGEWIILRAGRSITAQTTRPAPKSGLGFETDKFSRTALDHHFAEYYDKLLKRIGPRRHKTSGLTTLHFDSWEMGSQNWTEAFPTEFENRRGYSLTHFLPAFDGYIVDEENKTERFLWDVRQTAQELVIANQAGRLRDLGHENGLVLALEPYDLNPTSDLELGRVADVPMAEFWSRFGVINSDWSVVEATSVGHTNGRRIIAAESFTAEPQEHWLQHPASMKDQGDWALCAGINRIVFHRFQDQPWNDRFPGMTMGPGAGYGVHWDRTQTWWDMVGAYHLYLSRCQTMLRRGLPVADVLYLAAEGAPCVFLPPPSVFLPGNMPDRRGYNFDGCSPETLIERASVSDGNITFPDGMSYRLLVLPQVETMTPRLLRKVAELVEHGATIVGLPPKSSPSLGGYPHCDDEVQTIATQLWGEPTESAPRTAGNGKVWFDDSAARFGQINPLADAQWIWCEAESAPGEKQKEYVFTRKFEIKDAAAITLAQVAITASPSFSVSVNGVVLGKAKRYEQVRRYDATSLLRNGTNEVTVLAGAESSDYQAAPGILAALSIVRGASTQHIVTDTAWTASSPTEAQARRTTLLGGFEAAPWKLTKASLEEANLYPSYRQTQKVLEALRIAPDFDGGDDLRFIHRRDREVDIYFIANRRNEELTRTCSFRARGKKPQWWDPMTGESRELPELHEQGDHTQIPVRLAPHESGFIVFGGAASAQHNGAENFPVYSDLTTIPGPWQVSFDPRWGGPAAVRFEHLSDWSSSSDDGIRSYSGKAVYRTHFDCAGIKDGQRHSITLGEVHVIASVTLNGRTLGTAWCRPWRLAVPKGLLKPQDNEIEITVANLWINRLIRDSGLPEEKRLTWVPENPFHPDAPLERSGLLGPVVLQVS